MFVTSILCFSFNLTSFGLYSLNQFTGFENNFNILLTYLILVLFSYLLLSSKPRWLVGNWPHLQQQLLGLRIMQFFCKWLAQKETMKIEVKFAGGIYESNFFTLKREPHSHCSHVHSLPPHLFKNEEAYRSIQPWLPLSIQV